jgi:PIN domain nuclease of toxin-antitoxin system
MTKVVLDSSVVLAYLQNEPGAEIAEYAFGDATMSSVNLTEILTKLMKKGTTLDAALAAFDALRIPVADFTRSLAEDAGALSSVTARLGLSLGDRACLALARRENLPAMTTDRAWKDLDVGVEIELIR